MGQQVGPVRRFRFFGLAAVVLLGLALVAAGVLVTRRLTARHPVCGPSVPNADSTCVAEDSLGKGEMLAGVLARWCLPQTRVNDVHAALAKTDFNFRNMRPGDVVALAYQGLDLVGITYRKDPVTSYGVRFDPAGATATKEVKPVDTVRVVLRGAIKGSLWNSMIEMGETPGLVVNFAEILGYEVDFLTEVSEGDTFELLLDKLYVDSVFYRDGRVYAVHYKGQAGNYYGFYYRSPSGRYDFYNETGQSLRKTVLRSPLQFVKVTSHFGMRFHPILRTWRQHTGIDYGAPTGTPVSAIADGTVTMARWNGGYGNFVQIRHSGRLVSCYGHLSRYGAGMKAGRSVRQGQTVGYVGMTGLATGPHLHFEVRQSGKPVNPLKVVPPRAEPVAKKSLPEFNALKSSCLADLARPAGPVTAVTDSVEPVHPSFSSISTFQWLPGIGYPFITSCCRPNRLRTPPIPCWVKRVGHSPHGSRAPFVLAQLGRGRRRGALRGMIRIPSRRSLASGPTSFPPRAGSLRRAQGRHTAGLADLSSGRARPDYYAAKETEAGKPSA